jgi:hypothetical protein
MFRFSPMCGTDACKKSAKNVAKTFPKLPILSWKSWKPASKFQWKSSKKVSFWVLVFHFRNAVHGNTKPACKNLEFGFSENWNFVKKSRFRNLNFPELCAERFLWKVFSGSIWNWNSEMHKMSLISEFGISGNRNRSPKTPTDWFYTFYKSLQKPKLKTPDRERENFRRETDIRISGNPECVPGKHLKLREFSSCTHRCSR